MKKVLLTMLFLAVMLTTTQIASAAHEPGVKNDQNANFAQFKNEGNAEATAEAGKTAKIKNSWGTGWGKPYLIITNPSGTAIWWGEVEDGDILSFPGVTTGTTLTATFTIGDIPQVNSFVIVD